MRLTEGGNVFKDEQGAPLTQRINQQDVAATIQWIERVTGIEFPQERWLGSTGRKATSGDLDLAVDTSEISKEELAQRLTAFVQKNGQDPRTWVKKAGEVHFRTPIAGRAGTGFVQTDFMFFPDLDWGTFYYAQGADSAYKGMNRAVLMSSIAKQLGLKVGANGVFSRANNELVTMDPDRLAEMILGRGKSRKDLATVESIYAALAQDPERDAKLRDFREYLAREGLQEPTTVAESDVNFLARLRDRIVNQGMQPLVEAQVVREAEEAGVGGRAKGIEHLEDLVFRRGTAGVRQALDIVTHMAQEPSSTTVKWDGKPAVIFGRKPSTGEFVLTDGSGFEARGYDGLATSPEMMAQIQSTRGGERAGITQLYRDLWPKLEAALPENFRGYVKGDLLYTQRPPLQAGNYVFQPNTVEYRIPARSSLGQQIGDSDTGVAMHSMYADQGEPMQPLSRVRFDEVPGLLLISPIQSRGVELNSGMLQEIRRVVRQHGADIDTLFNPAELRQQQITDLAKLCVDYINHRIRTGNFDNLLAGFGEWLRTKVTPRKFTNIIEYLQSPSSNTQALAAAFTLFMLLHDLKMDLLRQLDLQVPGNEGWVMATPHGYAKAVNRFDFTARNQQRNNP